MSRAAEQVQTRAEILKLARLLGREADELSYLEVLTPADVRRLRDGVTESLYDAHDGSLRKLAAASRLLPSSLIATIAERAFGPLLSARVAGLLDLDRAVEVSGRLAPAFLAEVAGELDPRRASELIASIPPRLIGQITRELALRDDYVTMGRFVGHLSDGAIIAALSALDDAALLRVAFVLEDKQQLRTLVATLPRARVRGIIAAAAAEELWVEALDLLHHLAPAQRRDMIKATLALDDAALEAIVQTVLDHALWPEVLLIAEHDGALQDRLAERLASLPVRRRRAALRDARDAGVLGRLGAIEPALTGA
ncbi:MAG TPA: hypothetical protein VFN87_04770 [Solirubrobacteraceae bacterium]|nr:hypothetical protein [Solirubrobacteraceae bacterium]